MITFNRTIEKEVLRLAQYYHVITITGPRQSGKTTLCKKVFPDYEYINLEDETIRVDIDQSRKSYFVAHRHGLIIDEAQNMPEVFSIVQVVVDEYEDARFVLTGSNNFLLMQKITQSLAGRTALLTLLPLSIAELPGISKETSPYELMYRGFYPAIWSKNMPA